MSKLTTEQCKQFIVQMLKEDTEAIASEQLDHPAYLDSSLWKRVEKRTIKEDQCCDGYYLEHTTWSYNDLTLTPTAGCIERVFVHRLPGSTVLGEDESYRDCCISIISNEADQEIISWAITSD